MSDDLDRLRAALTGRYEIERELGSGGMATVYLARDVKHDRDVAIKVLHPDLGAALGSSRFLAEIRTTAKLQHPHILPLLDSGEADGLLYYAMPFITGQTLRQRLEKEAQLPINAAIAIAKEVADALGAAHEMGIIHRDIKPENILLRGNHALVADFGIALAVEHAGGARMTATGLSLGTPHYMSPEQAMGDRKIGPPSDIYSLGAVVYEMLAGEPPFTGSTVHAIVAKVMTERPVPLSVIRDTVSPALENAIYTALAKTPADRFSTASDFSAALTAALSGDTAPQPVATPRARTRVRDPLVIGLGVAAIGFATIAGLATMKSLSRTDTFPYRMEVTAPEDQIVGQADLSPDGRTLVFVGRDPVTQVQVLRLRRLDQLSSRLIPGAARVQGPVFSPDGKWVAYVSGRRKLMKVPVDGGSPVPLADVDDFGGASWSRSGHIVVGGGSHEMLRGIRVVNANGGPLTPLTKVDTADKSLSHQHPVVLADGKTVLFTIWYGNISKAELGATRIGDGKITKLGVTGTQALGVVDGQLIYTGPDAMLMAIPFDIGELRTTGGAKPIQDSVIVRDPWIGNGHAYLASNGALVYARGGTGKRLVWVNLNGQVSAALNGLHAYRHVRISPDGKRAALGIDAGLKIDLWVLDFASGTLTTLTEDGSTRNPVWASDGKRIFFVSTKGGRASFWHTSADGSMQPVELGRSKQNNAWSMDLSPDQQTIAFNVNVNGTFNLQTYDVDAPHAEREIAASPTAAETQARFSPDGKFIAYTSDESGRNEVYVRSYPENSIRLQISVDGGNKPVWSPEGNRIYYWDGRTMMMAAVTRQQSLRVLSRQALFSGDYLQDYDVASDGSRLLMIENPVNATELVVVPNWPSELRAKTR